jgi:hypothetical protein
MPIKKSKTEVKSVNSIHPSFNDSKLSLSSPSHSTSSDSKTIDWPNEIEWAKANAFEIYFLLL